MAEMIYSLRLENLKVRAMLDIERDRVSSLRLHMSLSQEEFRQIRRDRDDARGRLRRLEMYLGRRFGGNYHNENQLNILDAAYALSWRELMETDD
ncbi:hypothetical protein Tco_0645594 [Tanacetum coccineum]